MQHGHRDDLGRDHDADVEEGWAGDGSRSSGTAGECVAAPAPGTGAAAELGCRCSVLANSVAAAALEPLVAPDCPVHADGW